MEMLVCALVLADPELAFSQALYLCGEWQRAGTGSSFYRKVPTAGARGHRNQGRPCAEVLLSSGDGMNQPVLAQQ